MLTDFFNWLSKLLRALWLFMSGVIAVAAIYYLLTGVEQGIDVVIQSGELLDAGILTILAVFLWSFLVWYSSRTLSYIKQHKDDEIFLRRTGNGGVSPLYLKYGIPSAMYQHIPRMLAYNCFVSLQVAIFHLPTFFSSSNLWMLLIVLAHNGFYFLLDEWFRKTSSASRKVLGWLVPLIIAGYCTFLVRLVINNAEGIDVLRDPLRHRFWLSVIATAMFLLQVGVVYLFIQRRKAVDARRNDLTLRRSRLLTMLGYNPVFNAAEAPYFHALNATAAVAVLIYLTAIFVMPFAALMGPMAFTLMALGILTGLANLVTLASIRSSFNVSVILVGLAFVFGEFREPYAVRFLETNEERTFAQRPDAQSFLKKWFERRVSRMDTIEGKFPVYIVLSNGGASRAGKWTSGVLSTLQDTSFRMNPADSFGEHVLCIAGSSGGTVGNCVFYSLLSASRQGQIRSDAFALHANRFFETDFLTFTLARLLGPDLLRHLSPVNLPVYNRADALETVLSHGSDDALLNRYFDSRLTEVLDTTGALPALFINTTQVDNGMPGVMSSLLLPAMSQRQDVLSLVDSVGAQNGHGDIRLSTAAVLSSRFPYVSPAGKVFDRYYVDGGYFDNSGAGMVLEFIHELNRFMADTVNADVIRHRDRFTFHLLHITNSEIPQSGPGNIHPLTNDLLAPVLTLAGMQGSSTSIGEGMLINAFRQFNADTANSRIVYSLYDESWDRAKNEGRFEEGYPMSWALSDYQISRMDAALRRANARNLEKFGFTVRIKQ